jgi:hypothetical protein
MINKDYSKNVKLLRNEIIDYDTVDKHETGINKKRMRLPERYDIAKYYKRNKRNQEKGKWIHKNEDDLLEFTDAYFDWQITYSFPSDLHNNETESGKIYGGKTVTYRRLYLILCEAFNGGEFFVDEYFNSVYPNSWVKERVDVELNNLQDELTYYASDLLEGAVATTKGELDRRYKANRGKKARIKEWQAFARQWEEEKGEELADYIANDIKRALEVGEIPLNRKLSERTKKLRRSAGLNDETVFYATGDLIDHIQLFVKIGGNGKWKTEQGLLV